MLLNKQTYATVRIEKTEEFRKLEQKAKREMNAIRAYKSGRLGKILFFDFVVMVVLFFFLNIEPTLQTGLIVCGSLIAFNIYTSHSVEKAFKKNVEKYELAISDNLQSMTEQLFSHMLNEKIEEQIKAENIENHTTIKSSLSITDDYYDIVIKY